MKRSELEDQLVKTCVESEFPLAELLSTLARVRQRVQKGMMAKTVSSTPKRSFKPLTRPSGNMMGKQKSQPKEKD